jgi:hypothetical protein
MSQMAYQLDVSRKTIYSWADEHPEFLHILEKAMPCRNLRL